MGRALGPVGRTGPAPVVGIHRAGVEAVGPVAVGMLIVVGRGSFPAWEAEGPGARVGKIAARKLGYRKA